MLFKSINADDLVNFFKLEEITTLLASTIDHTWKANSKQTFNIANNCQVDTTILNEIKEFKFALSSCNNSSASGLDKLSWNHLKIIFEDIECLDTFV